MSLQLDWTLEQPSTGQPPGRHPTPTVADAVALARTSAARLPRLAPLGAARTAHRTLVRPARPVAAHRRRGGSYRLMVGAGAISSIGDGLALVAFPLLATTLTRSPALIAGVAIATRLPWLLVAMPAGALADRLDRRRLLATVEAARMVVLLALGLSIVTRHVDLVQLYAAAFLLGSFETCFVATTQAVLPTMVAGDELPKANGRLFAAQITGEQFIGPAIGGIVFAVAASLPFVADGVSFAASALLLALALPRRRPAATAAVQAPAPRRSLIREAKEGITWLLGHPTLRLAAAMVSTFAFCSMMALAVLVVYGLRVLHLSGTAFGLFVAAGAIGNVVGGLVAHRVIAAVKTGPVLILAGLLAGCAYLVVGTTSTLGFAVGAFALEALAVGVGNVATLSLRQSLIPSELAGRVNAALRMCISGAAAAGGAVGGVLATALAVHAPFVVAGLIQLPAAVLIGLPLARVLSGGRRAAEDLEVPEWVNAGPDVEEPALVLVTDVA